MEAEKLRRLLALLNADLSDPASDPCAALVHEAKAEALIEAKAILKDMFVQALLQTTLEKYAPVPATASHSALEPAARALHREAPPVPRQEAPPPPQVERLPEAPSAPPEASPPVPEAPRPIPEAPPPVPGAPPPPAPEAPRPIPEAPPPSVPETPPPDPAADDRQQLLSEMEAIRRQLAENEERLRRTKAPPSGEAPPPVDAAAAPVAAAAAPEDAPAPADGATAPTGAVETYAYYVYGLLPATAALAGDGWHADGIDPAHPVVALPHREIQAAVSKVPLSEYGEQELAVQFEDLQWVENKVRRHQEVLEALMQQGTLIPFRFCTLYRDAERVQQMLAEHYDRWAKILATLQGKQEWGVKMYLTPETLAQKVGEVSPRIQQLNAQIAHQSSGAAYFAKKKLEAAVEEEVERLGDTYAQDSHDRLAGCAVEACLNSLRSSELAEDVRMLLNAAYLVDQAQWPAFRALIAALEEQYGSLGVTYALTGPWPPYNFVHDSAEGDSDEPGRP